MNLHDELDHLHELLEFGDLVHLPVGLVDVEPALADVTERGADAGAQGRDPAVLQKQGHLQEQTQSNHVTHLFYLQVFSI